MEHRPRSPEPVDRPNGDVPRRVVVVDDEPTAREVVARYLERDGMTVEQASDGVQALDALKRHPDLVVLDIMIPGTSGLEVLREIRQAGETPVILLTALSDETDRVAVWSWAPTTTSSSRSRPGAGGARPIGPPSQPGPSLRRTIGLRGAGDRHRRKRRLRRWGSRSDAPA